MSPAQTLGLVIIGSLFAGVALSEGMRRSERVTDVAVLTLCGAIFLGLPILAVLLLTGVIA